MVASTSTATSGIDGHSKQDKSSDRLTIQEKLLLSQAVYKLGAISWPEVSRLLVQHPCCKSRPAALFSPEACEAYYVELMRDIGINVPAEGAMKPSAKVHLRLAQTFYFARMEELQAQISTYEQRFTVLMAELTSLKNGEMDESIRSELRTTLARKYGKKLLDTWVPEKNVVQDAVQAGPATAEEKEVEEMKKSKEAEVPEKVIGEGVTEDVEMVTAERRQPEDEAGGAEGRPAEGETEDQDQSAQVTTQDRDGEIAAQSSPHEPEKALVAEAEVDEEASKADVGAEPAAQQAAGEDEKEQADQDDETEPSKETSRNARRRISRDAHKAKEIPKRAHRRRDADRTDDEAHSDEESKKTDAQAQPEVDEEPEVQEVREQEDEPMAEVEPETEIEPEDETEVKRERREKSFSKATVDKKKAPKTPRKPSPAPSNRSELSPAPGSDLSPAPSDHERERGHATDDAEAETEDEDVRPHSIRLNKRKATAPPRDAPSSKRTGRRGTKSNAKPSPAPTQESEAVSEAEHDQDHDNEHEHEHDHEHEREADAEASGRRSTRRGRESTSRATAKKPQDSPAASTRTKDSSPTVSRRAPSVSSVTSAGHEEKGGERRSTRRGAGNKYRGMRDDIVSKSVREQSAAVESVKDEHEEHDGEQQDDEADKKPVRTSSRRKTLDATKDKDKERERDVFSTPAEKRGTRASARIVRDSVEGEHDPATGAGSVSADVSGEFLDIGTPASASASATPVPGSRRLNQAQRVSQKLLFSLLDTVSSHRNGNVFQNPVKKSAAPDYREIVKRPMDLKTIRSRIKDGQISTIDEFERDALLIFANAMMYNGPDSDIYDMAKEMLKDTEAHIAHFKNVQHHVNR